MSKQDFSWVEHVPEGTTHIYVFNRPEIEKGLFEPCGDMFERHTRAHVYEWSRGIGDWLYHTDQENIEEHSRIPIHFFIEKHEAQKFGGEIRSSNAKQSTFHEPHFIQNCMNKMTFENCTVEFENHTNSGVTIEVETVGDISYATISIGGDE